MARVTWFIDRVWAADSRTISCPWDGPSTTCPLSHSLSCDFDNFSGPVRKKSAAKLVARTASPGVDSKLRDNLERLKKIRAHRSLRHFWDLRVCGQHTKTNGRRGKTVVRRKDVESCELEGGEDLPPKRGGEKEYIQESEQRGETKNSLGVPSIGPDFRVITQYLRATDGVYSQLSDNPYPLGIGPGIWVIEVYGVP
ncbi:hypothetical protein EDB85DRAFT_2278151 [Lactarius pseudohatsudake]|nr:hypothetical protein EDB85DRAFT_2278151 [Lactarius pseudohatsudake]